MFFTLVLFSSLNTILKQKKPLNSKIARHRKVLLRDHSADIFVAFQGYSVLELYEFYNRPLWYTSQRINESLLTKIVSSFKKIRNDPCCFND